MEETKPKKRKSKSLSKQLKEMRESRDELRKDYDICWQQRYALRRQLEQIETIFPKKFYKITFTIKANSGLEVNLTEIHEGYTPQLAIEKLKSNKTHPKTFKLIDIEEKA